MKIYSEEPVVNSEVILSRRKFFIGFNKTQGWRIKPQLYTRWKLKQPKLHPLSAIRGWSHYMHWTVLVEICPRRPWLSSLFRAYFLFRRIASLWNMKQARDAFVIKYLLFSAAYYNKRTRFLLPQLRNKRWLSLLDVSLSTTTKYLDLGSLYMSI